MKKKLQIACLMLFSCLLAGCSSEAKKETDSVYSPETEREFQAIEKNEVRISPLYRSNQRDSQRPLEVNKAATREIKGPRKTAPVLSPLGQTDGGSRLSIKNQERLQEINQNLAFFCMKHRKSAAFKNEDQCISYTKKVLAACERNHKLINSVMVNCIKDRLRKRI